MDNSSRTCRACGRFNISAIPQSQEVTNAEEKAKNLEKIKRFAKSVPFILGVILITVSATSTVFFNPSWDDILGLVIAGIHIVALWMLVFESSLSQTSYKATLVSLKLFRVSAVLAIVLFAVVYGLLAIGLLFALLRGIMFLLLLAFVVGIAFVLIKYYCIALLKILKDIQTRIELGGRIPMDSLNSFLVVSYILIALGVIQVIVGLANGQVLSSLLSVASSVGMLLCLLTLKRYEESL